MTQTIPGSAERNGVGHTPVAGETISGGHLVAKALKAEGGQVVQPKSPGHWMDPGPLGTLHLPFVGIVGNNSSMNQIRYGQIQKYGEDRGRVGNTLGNVKYDQFAKMLGGCGEEVRDPADIAPRAATRPGIGTPLTHQCVGRPRGPRPGHHEPDDVQVIGGDK
jgi:hypothetical protein